MNYLYSVFQCTFTDVRLILKYGNMDGDVVEIQTDRNYILQDNEKNSSIIPTITGYYCIFAKWFIPLTY